MRASILPILSLLAAGCSGPADVVVAPTSSADPNAKRMAPSATMMMLVEPPIGPKPRVAGSKFSASATEPLPSGAIARCGTTSMRLPDRATVAVTNDGTIYAFRGGEELVDLRKNTVLAKLPSGQRAVFSPDAKKLSLTHSSDVVELFEIPSGKSLGSTKIELTKPKAKPATPGASKRFGITGPGGRYEYLNQVEFSADGSRIVVSTSFGTLHVIDATTGKRLKTQKTPNSQLAGLSRDGSRALMLLREPGKEDVSVFLMSSASYVGFSVVNLVTGAKLLTKNFGFEKSEPPLDPAEPVRKVREHQYASHGLALDGETVYRLEHGALTSIDVASGKEDEISEKGSVDVFGGGLLLGGSGDLEMLVDGRSARAGGQVIDLGTGSARTAELFAFQSQNGEYDLERTGSVVHLSTEDVVGHSSSVTALSFLPSGEGIVTADGALHFWDAASCEELPDPEIRATDFRAARDEGVLVIDGYPSLIIDAKGELTSLKSALRARNFALSSDGAKLFVGTSDYQEAELEVLDRKGAKLASVAVGGSVNGVAVSPGGSRVALTVYKGDAMELQVRKADTLAVERSAGDVDDRILFLGEDRVLEYDGHRGVTERVMPDLKAGFKLSAANCCSVVALSKDQRLLAGSSENDIFVWELPEPKDGVITPRFLSQLSGHTGRVTSLAFSAEGVLASGSEDTTLLLWDVAAAAKQPESSHGTRDMEGPALASRWSTGDQRGRNYIKDDGTVDWGSLKGKQPALTGVVSLSTNYGATCAITDAPAGKVRCWGSTRGGVLGIPEKPGAKPYQFLSEDKPVEVPKISDAVRVELTSDYGCALHGGSKLSCWGKLGAGPISAPTEIASGVTSFAVQSGRACALTNAGELSCWESSDGSPPKAIASNVRALAMGTAHLCYLDTDEKVSCMGRGAQLGDASGGERKTPGLVDRLSRVSEISAGSYGTCVRARPSGEEEDVYCWGDFAHADHLVPTLMRGLSGTKGLLVLGDRACASKAGKLVCVTK